MRVRGRSAVRCVAVMLAVASSLAASTSRAQNAAQRFRVHWGPQPEDAVEHPPPPRWDPARDIGEPRAAVYVDAVWSAAIGPLVGRYNITAGSAIALRRSIALVLEAGYETGCVPDGYSSCSTGYQGGTLSVGVAFSVGGRRPLEGFYLQPTLMIAGFTTYTNRALFPLWAPVTNYVGGLNLGYQITRGRFYAALGAGLTLGLGIGSDDAAYSIRGVPGRIMIAAMLHGVGPVRGAIIGLNPLSMRIGFSF